MHNKKIVCRIAEFILTGTGTVLILTRNWKAHGVAFCPHWART
jgi:hypothetical protein